MKNQYLLVTISDEVEKNCDPSVNASPKTFFSHDRRAPGCEMKSLQKQMDYDQKRLMAPRAIQNKPAGEPRTPTPSWSGLGFSNSMPENVIREKVANANNIEEKQIGGATPTNFKLDDPIFGNSSAFDAFIQQNKASNIVILPSDDLPTVSVYYLHTYLIGLEN